MLKKIASDIFFSESADFIFKRTNNCFQQKTEAVKFFIENLQIVSCNKIVKKYFKKLIDEILLSSTYVKVNFYRIKYMVLFFIT